MDPITTAVVAAASAGVTTVGKQAVVDAYNGLKKIIASKFEKDNQVSQTITEVEKNPDSKGQQMVLSEQVAATKADQDAEIVKIAQELIKALKSTDAGRKVIAKFQIGAKGAQVGVIGDQAHIEGGIHFGEDKK
jgi:hypothetical protein